MTYLGTKIRSQGLIYASTSRTYRGGYRLGMPIDLGKWKAQPHHIPKITAILGKDEKGLSTLWLADRGQDAIQGEREVLEALRFAENIFSQKTR
ncbi:hypothetical protein [Algoriphagus sp.]|uniref:hypothetical protein n=1 Tax=Algoriphagus sp. TaxID=1872435 RepID=UPI003F6E9354